MDKYIEVFPCVVFFSTSAAHTPHLRPPSQMFLIRSLSCGEDQDGVSVSGHTDPESSVLAVSLLSSLHKGFPLSFLSTTSVLFSN